MSIDAGGFGQGIYSQDVGRRKTFKRDVTCDDLHQIMKPGVDHETQCIRGWKKFRDERLREAITYDNEMRQEHPPYIRQSIGKTQHWPHK